MAEYEEDPSVWAWPGPTRATAIVACLPAFMDASGEPRMERLLRQGTG